MKKILAVLLVVLFLFIGNTCLAYDFSKVSTINTVDASYIPRKVYFTINSQPSQCGWLIWFLAGNIVEDQRESVKSVYQGLMTAMVSGRSVNVYVSYISGSGNCKVDFIHFK